MLNSKQTHDLLLAICEVQFLETHIDDIFFKDKMTNIVWTGIKHAIDASVKGYVNAKGGINIPLAGGSGNLSTPLEQVKGEEEVEEKEKEKEQYVAGLNEKAFEMWIAYKGKSYTRQGKTLSMNKLAKYDKATQQEMVENSIMNSYKGLIEPKTKKVHKSSNTTNDTIDKFFAQKNKGEIIDARID